MKKIAHKRRTAVDDAEGPLYRKVVGALRSDIREGTYPVDSQLPPEAALCARFGVSRHTIREALRQLRDEGLIASRQGAGTRVVSADGSAGFVHEVASIADLIAYAEEQQYHVDSSGMIVTDAALAARLDCATGERWLRIEGLRYPEGEKAPSAWTEVFVHADFAGIALFLGRRPGPIYHWIEEMYGTRIGEVEQEFVGRRAPPEVAGALKLQTDAAMIEARRSYVLENGAIALVAFTLHPIERFRLNMTLRRSRG